MNNIKAGYKQTEVGLIPSDWEVHSLNNEISALDAGISVNSVNEIFDAENDYAILKTSCVSNGSFISIEAKKIVTSEIQRAKLNPKSNHIIISRMNTPDLVGECGYVSKDYPNLFLPDRLWMMSFKKSSFINARWLNYILNYSVFRQKIRELGTGTSGSMKNISKGKLLEVLIPYPNEKEQTAIANALSDANALISSLDKLIAKKRNIKQGAMQELLKTKEGWEVKKLGEIGKCLRGVSYNPERDLHPHDKNSTVRLLRSNNVQNQNIDLNALQYVDQERVKQNQLLQDNDIVICMANGSKQLVGKSAIFKVKDKLNYTFGAFMGCFRTNIDLASSSFIALNFQSFQYRNYIDVLLSGSSINNLNPGNIESIEIPFPPAEEQTRIATILSDMDAEISALETKLEKYRRVKQGMMQELLTGRIRLV